MDLPRLGFFFARMGSLTFRERRSQPLRIAIDTGGTVTDCVWIDPRTQAIAHAQGVFDSPRSVAGPLSRPSRKLLQKTISFFFTERPSAPMPCSSAKECAQGSEKARAIADRRW